MEYLKRNEEENWQYYMRLYDNKETYGLTFSEIGDLLNEVYGTDWNEAKFRRMYDGYKMFQDFVGKDNLSHQPQDILKEIEKEKQELKKERVKTRDTRRENATLVRRMARLENLEEFLIEHISEYERTDSFNLEPTFNNGSQAMVLLSDWHLGANVKGRFNTFNDEIARERIDKVFNKVYNKVIQDEIELLHIANLGDLVHGIIHVSTKVQSEEDVIQQVIKASDYLCRFIEPFIDLGIHVKYYNVVGNHGRVTPNKNEVAGIEENFEKLILTIIETKFGGLDNFESIGCQDGLIETTILDKKFILTHGNFDSKANASFRIPQLLGYVPDYILSGHVHHDTSTDYGTTMHIVNPSLIGADDYATSGRYGGRAGQKLITFDENDIDSISTIYL